MRICSIDGESTTSKFCARGDSNAIALNMECFDLAGLAETVSREARVIDQTHEFESRLSPVEVCADAALIKQALEPGFRS